MTHHIFIICEGETPKQSWLRDASTFALFGALMGVGTGLESVAMQGAGFLVAMVMIIAKAQGHSEKYTSAADAIAKIKEIEAKHDTH